MWSDDEIEALLKIYREESIDQSIDNDYHTVFISIGDHEVQNITKK